MSLGSIGRGVRRLLAFGALLLVLLAVAGTLYQLVGVRHDRRTLPPPGELVSIGSHRMHIACAGQGSTPVLLDAGAGGWSLHWFAFRDALAAAGRVCAFDRSGLGWSEPGGAADGASLTDELHALLAAAGIDVPVVYVGHSLGANLAQLHANRYPGDVAGIVLIDPGRPVDMLEDFDGTREDALARERCGWKCGAASVATRLGITRFASRNAGRRTLGEEVQRAYHAGISRQSAARTIVSYLELLPKTAHQLLDIDGYGDLPLTIIYSGDTREPEKGETPADVARWHAGVLEDMSKLAGSSTRGRGPIVVPGATHQTIVTNPEFVRVVIGEIERMRAEIVPVAGGRAPGGG